MELEAIYPAVERRTDEYNALKELHMQEKHCYPTYRMLFTKDYLKPTAIGIGFIALRIITGHYTVFVITWSIFASNQFQPYSTVIFGAVAFLGAIIPFFLIDSIIFNSV